MCSGCYRLHKWALPHLCDVTTGTGICWGDCRRLQTRLSLPCPPALGHVTFRMALAENPTNFPTRNPSSIKWKITGTQAGTRSAWRAKWQGCVLCDGMESAGVQRRTKNEETSLHSCKWWSCATFPPNTHTHTHTHRNSWRGNNAEDTAKVCNMDFMVFKNTVMVLTYPVGTIWNLLL